METLLDHIEYVYFLYNSAETEFLKCRYKTILHTLLCELEKFDEILKRVSYVEEQKKRGLDVVATYRGRVTEKYCRTYKKEKK